MFRAGGRISGLQSVRATLRRERDCSGGAPILSQARSEAGVAVVVVVAAVGRSVGQMSAAATATLFFRREAMRCDRRVWWTGEEGGSVWRRGKSRGSVDNNMPSGGRSRSASRGRSRDRGVPWRGRGGGCRRSAWGWRPRRGYRIRRSGRAGPKKFQYNNNNDLCGRRAMGVGGFLTLRGCSASLRLSQHETS